MVVSSVAEQVVVRAIAGHRVVQLIASAGDGGADQGQVFNITDHTSSLDQAVVDG